MNSGGRIQTFFSMIIFMGGGRESFKGGGGVLLLCPVVSQYSNEVATCLEEKNTTFV